MKKYKVFAIVSVVLLSVVLIISASYFWSDNNNKNENRNGYLTEAELASINITSHGVYVSDANSKIYVNGSADLPVMMGPMNAPSMYSFEILEVINPVIVIKDGTEVHFTIVNVDTDSYHNFVLGNIGPPYYYMGNMMDGGDFMYSMQYLPPLSSGHYAFENFTYNFSTTGTYWYLCTYPGHAENGMYGEIIVN